MFYGWRMVAVAFAAHFVASGLGFYALPRLLVPLADEFSGGERADVALLVVAMSLPGLLVAPLVGRLIARWSLRTVLPLGAVALAVGFALASRASSIAYLIAVYAIAVPIGVASLSGIGANALVANWFDRRRAMALGVSQFGLSISGAVATFFIGWTLANGGWRSTYVWFAGIALMSAPLLWWTITDRPAQRGLSPDGDERPEPPPAAGSHAAGGMPLAVAVREPNLWMLGLAAGLSFSATTGVLQNVHALATDAGHAPQQADTVLATLAVGAAFGKLLFGALGVRLGERAAFTIAIVGQGIGLALIPRASGSLALLVSLVLVFGLALGGVMPSLAALLARLYGAERFSSVMGYVVPLLIPFQMAGAPVAAWVYDRTGRYDAALYGFVVACGVAALLLLPVRPARAAPAVTTP